MTYSEAIAYLDSLAQFGWKLDLARIERLCELANHPERRFRSVLVGGSAGKGSTCSMLAAIFNAAGLRVGTAPKPHLHTHRERAQVDGALISEERFATLMAGLIPLAEQVTREEGSPTVFEVMTLLAFQHFAASAVDVAVVEVGLGGRLDATNVLSPELSIITSIGLDHTDRLGDTVELIAFEKAGIIKPGGRVVTGAGGGALGVIDHVAAERGTAVRALGRDFALEDVRGDAGGMLFDLRLADQTLRDVRTRLVGEHQARNGAVAAASALWLADRFPLSEQSVRQGLAAATLPARLQVVRQEPLVLVDGAHSPDRAEALALALRQVYLPGREGAPVVLVLGCSVGHAPAEVVGLLASLATVVIATKSEHPAAIPAGEVAAAVTTRACAEVVEPVAAAVARAVELAGTRGMVVVTGSLFVAAEALRALSADEQASCPTTDQSA